MTEIKFQIDIDTGELYDHLLYNGFLAQAAKNFASQENCVQNSFETMKKMDMLRTQLEFQYSAIERSLTSLDEVQDHIATLSH